VEHRGRSAFLLLAALSAAVVAVTIRRLPDPVAVHFGLRGVPDGWAGHEFYLALLAFIGLALPLGIVALVSRVASTRPEALNVPGKAYWLDPARRPEGVRRIVGQMWWLACLLLAFALGVHGLLLTANARVPPRLPTGAFLVLVGGFLLGLVWWTRSLAAAMRPPAHVRPQRGAT
jgi:uncharacterized protein DUF1648